MKIGILTHYTVVNQGAVLQMYALKNYLEELGHDVYILTYTKDFDFDLGEAGKYNLSLKYFPFYFREYVLKKGIGLSWFNVKKQLLYRKYLKNNFKFANYALASMDAVFVGSDEVFSLACGCNKMMYGHCVNTDKLIAYAPSFGQTDIRRIDQFHSREIICSGLKKFHRLSARDVNTAEVVCSLIGVKPPIVCDPVLLYDFSKVQTNIKKIKHPYLLVYAYDRSMREDDEVRAIKNYAKEKNLRLASIGTYHKWCDLNIVCNPIEWIEYFRNAAEVITDTFHGAVVSIITRKQATFYVRGHNQNKMTSLLRIFGLEKRIMQEFTESEIQRIQNIPTDFNMVKQEHDKLREQAEQYIGEALR